MAPKGKNKGKGKGVPNNQTITPPNQASTTTGHTSTGSPSTATPSMQSPRQFTMIPTPGHVAEAMLPSPLPSQGGAESGEVGGSSATQSVHVSTTEERTPLVRVGNR